MRGVDEGSARLRAGGWTRGDPRFGDPRHQFKAYNVAAGHMSLHPDFISMVNAASSPSLDVFEFGVCTGSRMREFGQRLHGFELPNETPLEIVRALAFASRSRR